MGEFLKNIKSSEFGMRVLEKIFPVTKKNSATILHYNQAMKRFHECETKKDPSRIREEIRTCRNYWKCYPYHYFICDLYRDDQALTKQELINYIPPFFWFYLVLPHHNSPKFSLVGENKLAIELFFKALEIVQSRNSILFFEGHFYSSRMEQLSFHRVTEELTQNNPVKIFVKPLEGSGGEGIFIFHKNDRGYFVTRENILFDTSFFKNTANRDFLIQPGIIQDPDISRIYPHSVNTFRIITENKNGTVRPIAAMLRMGQGTSDIDNVSSGGICTAIDINNGKLGDFATSYEKGRYTAHPDTRFIFSNQKIVRWNDIRSYATESAGKFPFFTYLGWDIALTPQGPVAIEINRSPAIDIIEKTACGLREAFGIDDPGYYWKNPGNRV